MRRLLLLFCLLLPFSAPAFASETPAEHAANVYAQQELDSHPLHQNIPDYGLSPEALAKSQHLSTIRVTLHFVNEAWGILSLLLMLSFGGIAWMRDRAVAASSNRWAQGFTFFFLYSVAGYLLDLPLSLYQQHLSREYGLSIQDWGGWFLDSGKSFGLGYVFGGLLLMLLFWIVRKFPRSWWLVFSGICIPLVLFVAMVTPLVDLLFNKFEPLSLHHADLVAQLEKVAERGHMNIPPDRMFLMKASEKVTTLNAYVTGFGASKRVVVWDTSLQKATPDEVLFIFGHESGHYVLNHIVLGICLSIVGLFISFFLAYHFIQWAIRRFGQRWGVPDQSDWAALGVLVLAFSLFGVIAEPVTNTFSRMDEHAADVYGEEAVHGIVADPQQSAHDAFVILGTNSFSDPNPSQLYEFWTFNHPAIGRRAAFAKAYDPWAPGMEPKYFPKTGK